MQASQKDVDERGAAADNNVKVGLSLQEQNAAASAAIAEERAAVAAAMAELQSLKSNIEELIKAVGAGVAEAAAGEARAQGTWELLQEHIASIAAGAAVTIDALEQPALVVCLSYCSLSAIDRLQLVGSLAARPRRAPLLLFVGYRSSWAAIGRPRLVGCHLLFSSQLGLSGAACRPSLWLVSAVSLRRRRHDVMQRSTVQADWKDVTTNGHDHKTPIHTVQADWKDLTNSAAAEVQSHLSGTHEDPAAALAACLGLRTALSRHAGELQRWAVALQIEAVRQGAALERLNGKEKQFAQLEEAEAALVKRAKEVDVAAAAALAEQVRRAPQLCCFLSQAVCSPLSSSAAKDAAATDAPHQHQRPAAVQERLRKEAAAAAEHARDLDRRALECSAREGSVSHDQASLDERAAAVAAAEAAAAAAADAAAAREAAADERSAAAATATAAAAATQADAERRAAALDSRAVELEAAVGECTVARRQLQDEAARLDGVRAELADKDADAVRRRADVDAAAAAIAQDGEAVAAARRDVEVRLCGFGRSAGTADLFFGGLTGPAESMAGHSVYTKRCVSVST